MGLIRNADLPSAHSDLRMTEQENQVFSSAELLGHTEFKKQTNKKLTSKYFFCYAKKYIKLQIT